MQYSMVRFILLSLLTFLHSLSATVGSSVKYKAVFYHYTDDPNCPINGGTSDTRWNCTLRRRLETINSAYRPRTSVPCTISKTYHSSVVEQRWLSSIKQVMDNTSAWLPGCARMRDDRRHIDRWMAAWNAWQLPASEWDKSEPGVRWLSWDNKTSETLSFFEITDDCNQDSRTRLQYVPIEPLMGFLRHPISHCFHQKDYLNKNYMLTDHARYVIPPLATTPTEAVKVGLVAGTPDVYKRFMFDLGASYYRSGAGGASQSWFVDTYLKFGIDFDRIIAWEANALNTSLVFAGYPAEIVSKLTYFNVPCTTGPLDSMNPIRMLKQLTRPEDYVVFKIDIDHPVVEMELMDQIIDDPAVHPLIDELYFEHHVSSSPMEHKGWGTRPKLMDLTASYQLFLRLRKLGIRAHSWV